MGYLSELLKVCVFPATCSEYFPFCTAELTGRLRVTHSGVRWVANRISRSADACQSCGTCPFCVAAIAKPIKKAWLVVAKRLFSF